MDRAEDIIQKTQHKYKLFGINKIREISRLVFEISKRDNIDFDTIVKEIKSNDYLVVKNFLLKKRYPKTFNKVSKNSFYLPELNINEKNNVILATDPKFIPKNVFYTKDVVDSFLYNRVKILYPNANFMEIESIKSFLKTHEFSIQEYNKRKDNLFLINEKYDFFKRCPCTKNVRCCKYSILNIGYGCLYECSYCFLQGYQNVAGIILPCNLPDFLNLDKIKPIDNKMFFLPRVGSGEFTDSLIFDDITLFSDDIVKFFKENKNISFEFKTKSTNIEYLLKIGGSGNIVISWSVNAKQMIEENEHLTPNLENRLKAAQECVKAGYSVGFHFDPIIVYDDWKNGYKRAIEMIFDFIDGKHIKWISVGTLRMVSTLKKFIENRFPYNTILDNELLLSYDGKLRYETDLRIKVYKYMFEQIRLKNKNIPIYLCMENDDIWNSVE